MIKNLIFDVGGVLIGYRWKEMLMDDFGLSDEEAEKMGHMIFEDPIWREFDRGCVDIDSLVKHYISLHPDLAEDLKRFFYGDDKMATEREAVWERMEPAVCRSSGGKSTVGRLQFTPTPTTQ